MPILRSFHADLEAVDELVELKQIPFLPAVHLRPDRLDYLEFFLVELVE